MIIHTRLGAIVARASTEHLKTLAARWRRRAARWDRESLYSGTYGWHAPWTCAHEVVCAELYRRTRGHIGSHDRDDAVDRFYSEFMGGDFHYENHGGDTYYEDR